MSSIDNIVRRLREGRILQERQDYSKIPREELISLAQDGDQLAVETLIDTHKDFINRMTKKYILGGSDRDDITQMATIAFWDAINKYDPNINGDFEAFAGMNIKRRMTDEQRKDMSMKRQIHNTADSLDDTMEDDDGNEVSAIEQTPSKDMSPEEEYLGKEGARELVKFMKDKFSTREREVVLRYINGQKITQISEEMGLTYKSVENTLMRIRGKLTDYIKRPQHESRRIEKGKDIKFSDEEKKILESVITKVNEREAIRESRISEMRKSYEDYTESQIEDEFDNIYSEVEILLQDIEYTYYDERDRILNKLESLEDKLSSMEEYVPEDMKDHYDELVYVIRHADDVEYIGPDVRRDPYEERGLHRSDFY